ncbi:MAG: hypothetical protein LBQ50_09695 [Planctomycetaceae bacterium]|jgi:hypothetical protein|nr:hypothetical protein [Planctomycetaceae bacterium]
METVTTNERLDQVLDEITKHEIEIFVQESIERHKDKTKKPKELPENGIIDN